MSETLKLVTGMPYQFDTAIIANGGDANSAVWLQKINARQIILLEPDAKAYSKLEKQISILNLKNVQLKQKALVPKEQDKVTFFTATASEFSSVCEPQKIKKLRPGVSFQSGEADSISLAALISDLNIDASKANLLVLNVNGLEAELIAHLDNNVFNCLIVRTSSQLLYSKVDNLSVLQTCYAEQNIPLVTVSESLPPCVNLVTVRAVNWHESEQKLAQKQSMQELTKKLASLQKANDSLHAEINKTTNSLLESDKSTEDAKQTIKQKEATIAELQSQLNQQNETTQQAIQEKVKEIESLNTQVSQTAEHAQNMQAELESSRTQIIELNQKITNLEHSAQENSEHTSLLEIKITDLSNQHKEVNVALEKARVTNQELSHQKAMLNEEIAKVETQLEFIKDIVIREKAF